MISILTGTLSFDYSLFQMTDGNYWYKVISPGLLFRLFRVKSSRPLISGSAIIVRGKWILFFKKQEYVYRHFGIEEKENITDILRKRERICL